MEREIEGFKNYFITDDGRVISKVKSKHKELCQWVDNVGYKQVILRKNKKRCYKRVHILVAEAFVKGKSESNNMVNHIDGNKLNNNVENLEWDSNKKNTKHAPFLHMKISKVNSTVRLCGGIYSYMSGV